MRNREKLRTLMKKWLPNTVAVYPWLKENEISHSLAQRYQSSGWIKPFGNGAFIRKGDSVDEFGAVFSLQNYLKLPVHVGGLSALGLQGLSHYVRRGGALYIFNSINSNIPSWFRKSEDLKFKIYNTNFLPNNKFLEEIYYKDLFKIKISSPERAILEVLYLCPTKFDLVEAFHLIEGLTGLRPKILQELLENCNSIKVKRLACFLFEKVGYSWFELLDLSKIDFGNGKRNIVDKGFYNKKYNIIMPKELYYDN